MTQQSCTGRPTSACDAIIVHPVVSRVGRTASPLRIIEVHSMERFTADDVYDLREVAQGMSGFALVEPGEDAYTVLIAFADTDVSDEDMLNMTNKLLARVDSFASAAPCRASVTSSVPKAAIAVYASIWD